MGKVLFSLGMLLFTVAAYADGTVLFSTAKGGIDVPPYRIPGITCGNGGRLIASAARLVCGTDPGYGRIDCVVKLSDDNGRTWSEREIAWLVATHRSSTTSRHRWLLPMATLLS